MPFLLRGVPRAPEPRSGSPCLARSNLLARAQHRQPVKLLNVEDIIILPIPILQPSPRIHMIPSHSHFLNVIVFPLLTSPSLLSPFGASPD